MAQCLANQRIIKRIRELRVTAVVLRTCITTEAIAALVLTLRARMALRQTDRPASVPRQRRHLLVVVAAEGAVAIRLTSNAGWMALPAVPKIIPLIPRQGVQTATCQGKTQMLLAALVVGTSARFLLM